MIDPEAPRPEPSFSQLSVFRAVMFTGSVSRAAQLLGVTQSAASKLLRSLEDTIGLTLFERTQQRVIPTAYAHQLLQSVEELHGAYGAVQRTVQSLLESDHGVVSVAAIPTQTTAFLPQAIRRLKDQAPGVVVMVDVLANQPTISHVLNGQADFGLVHDLSPSPDTLNEDIGLQHLVCVACKGHRFERLSAITARQLQHEPIVSYGPQTNFGCLISAALARETVHLHSAVEVTSSAALLALVRAGVGVGIIEPAAIEPLLAKELIIRPLAPRIRVRSRILRSRIRPLTRHAELLLQEYRAIVTGAQPGYFCL